MNLGTVQHVFTQDGPFTSLHLDVSQDTQDAVQQRESRWTTARHRLEHEHVDSHLIEQLGERVRERTDLPGEARRTIVAAGDRIVLDDVRTGHSIWPEIVEHGALPDLSGWLHQLDGQIPFLLVTADREGADLDLYEASTGPAAAHEEVHGETLHITKVPQGDWAQKQFQQRSENVWRENAREVADTVRSVVARHRSRVVVLAGDERARSEIAHALDGLPCAVEQVSSGGRAAGASQAALWDDVRRVLARLEADDERQVTEALERTHRQGSGAALGLDEVLDALVEGKVERLVLDLEAAHQMTVRPADHPGLALPAKAADEAELPADRVLVAAGAATDTELTLLPRDQVKGGGVAALLRWDG